MGAGNSHPDKEWRLRQREQRAQDKARKQAEREEARKQALDEATGKDLDRYCKRLEAIVHDPSATDKDVCTAVQLLAKLKGLDKGNEAEPSERFRRMMESLRDDEENEGKQG